MSLRYAITAASLLIASCAAAPTAPPLPAPTCSGAADCNAKWEAAQLFVVKHSDQKIQVATNVLIETYNPTRSTNIAMRITKEPLGDGAFRIVPEIYCGNPFGCNASPSELRRLFTHIIEATTP